jgi:predicted amidohydrolase YtcJ
LERSLETVEGIQCMDEMACEGTLPVAMRVYIWAPGTMELDDACNWRSKFELKASEHMIRMQGIKLFADGGFSAKSAAVSCPYLGLNGQCGEIAFPKYFSVVPTSSPRRVGYSWQSTRTVIELRSGCVN